MQDIKHRGLVFGGEDSPVPYFTYAVTSHCNYACSYCCISAENHGFSGKSMPLHEMLGIGRLAYRQGVKIFRITGGEPTTWKPLGQLIEGIQDIAEDTHVNLNTNGSLPKLLLPLLQKYGHRMTVRVSIDRVSASPETPKVFTQEVENTLNEVRKYSPVRLNMVLMRTNLDELPLLIEKCDKLGFDIKLLDLYYNRDFFGVNGDGSHENNNYWWKNFLPIIDTVHETLVKLGFVFTQRFDHGGYGIPLPVYHNGNIFISIKDSTRGTSFHAKCHNCVEYRCQEGLYSPMLSYNGILHVGECRFSDFMTNLCGKSLAEKEEAVVAMLQLFADRKSSTQLPGLLQAYVEASLTNGGGPPIADSPPNELLREYRPVHEPNIIPLDTL